MGTYRHATLDEGKRLKDLLSGSSITCLVFSPIFQLRVKECPSDRPNLPREGKAREGASDRPLAVFHRRGEMLDAGSP
jgi:hypothetical protein